MSKRKTRKQKERSDQRTTISSPAKSSIPTPHYHFQYAPQNTPTNTQITTLPTFSYLSLDLKKTAIVSSVVIILEICLFTLMKMHVLALFGLQY